MSANSAALARRSTVVRLRSDKGDAGFEKMDNRTENQFDVQIKMDLNMWRNYGEGNIYYLKTH